MNKSSKRKFNKTSKEKKKNLHHKNNTYTQYKNLYVSCFPAL